MKTDLVESLKANKGNAIHLQLKDGETIPAGISVIDEVNNTVKYLHGQGLRALKDAQENNQPEQPIIDNPNNYMTRPISDIEGIV